MAHRREQKKRPRTERLERERAAQAATRLKRRLGLAAGGALTAAAVAVLVVLVASGAGGGSGSFPDGSVPERQVTDLRQAARVAGCSLRKFESEGEQHVDDQVSYRSNPPHSGNHNEAPADDGAYAEPVDDENLVHALEHGRVIFWFNPGRRGAPKAI
ncbi:MAG: DUF3105 domain-containing protein [Thermoleophilaceae bacterium]